VDGEQPAPPDRYERDRLFIYLRLESSPDQAQDNAVDELNRAGQPVVTLSLRDTFDLGREVFRWEMATAVAGSILGINSFDQPDVEASKVATRDLTKQFEVTGSLPEEAPFLKADWFRVFADPPLADVFNPRQGSGDLISALHAHLKRASVGDYFALLAYLPMNESNEQRLQSIRHRVRDQKKLATCLGFGPRFLHSTGQAYKGGPDEGVFLQITSDDPLDLPVPGQRYTFGVVKTAQARGDFRVMVERGRRALHIHLGRDAQGGLELLERSIAEALE